MRTPEGNIELDFTGRKNGRGVYLCHNAKCFNKARKSGKLATHLECAIPEEVLEALEAEIAGA